MSRRRHLIAASLCIFLAAAGATAVLVARSLGHPAVAPGYIGSVPPRGYRVPDFTLTSYRGRRVSMHSERGKVVVLTFLDTVCTDQCPPIAHAVGRAIAHLSPALRTRTVALAVSVDPRRDTPTSVQHFLRERRALVIDFLTRPVPALFQVWKRYHILSTFSSRNDNIHSAEVMIIDPSGVWVSSLSDEIDLTPASLAHDIRVASTDPAS
jgi:cytochrome oxidase Cu insertion factor (SCO1/SenC/PrrC family)